VAGQLAPPGPAGRRRRRGGADGAVSGSLRHSPGCLGGLAGPGPGRPDGPMAVRGRGRLGLGTAVPVPGIAMSGAAWGTAVRATVLAARAVAGADRPPCQPWRGRQGDSFGQAPHGRPGPAPGERTLARQSRPSFGPSIAGRCQGPSRRGRFGRELGPGARRTGPWRPPGVP
jgi:hypothetical protein